MLAAGPGSDLDPSGFIRSWCVFLGFVLAVLSGEFWASWLIQSFSKPITALVPFSGGRSLRTLISALKES